jgi:hypothetical protein
MTEQFAFLSSQDGGRELEKRLSLSGRPSADRQLRYNSRGPLHLSERTRSDQRRRARNAARIRRKRMTTRISVIDGGLSSGPI